MTEEIERGQAKSPVSFPLELEQTWIKRQGVEQFEY